MPRHSHTLALALCILPAVTCASAQVQVTSAQRALVIGINQYDGVGTDPKIVAERRLANLEGAVRDAKTMAAVLKQRGYAVRLLLNQDATRAGIFGALERFLEQPTRQGDDLVFYFAGHGSRLLSGDPNEPDGRDETLVPADAGAGVPDLLDDELRRRLHRLLDRGARLTVVLDACHSGSAVRGLPLGQNRAVLPMKIAAATPSERKPRDPVPLLEEGNALILAAAQDSQTAGEIADDAGDMRGIFTYSLLRALGAASPGESAVTTFRRTASLIAAEARLQDPVFGGSEALQKQPLLAPGAARSRSQDLESASAFVLADDQGRVTLEGGWTRGLRAGDELEAGAVIVRLEQVDPVRSRGRRLSGTAPLPGTALSRKRQGPRTEPDLTVFMPESMLTREQLLDFDRRIAALTAKHEVSRAEDPWHRTPTHVLRFNPEVASSKAGSIGVGWQLISRNGTTARLGASPQNEAIESALGDLPSGSSLFVQLPLPRGSAENIEIGAGSRYDAIEIAARPEGAHYQLVGRRVEEGLVYTWSRAGAGVEDIDESPLPPRTRDIPYQRADVAGDELISLAKKLARIRFWLRLESPPGDYFGYQLALVKGDESPIVNPSEVPNLALGERYGFALWTDKPGTVQSRHLYVLLLDANGRQNLLFPHPIYRNVENKPSLVGKTEQKLVPFGPQPLFTVSKPVGLDTYILLTTNEPIADPMVLDQSGVRLPRSDDHPLARLILDSQRGRRSSFDYPTDWSIDRLTVRVQP